MDFIQINQNKNIETYEESSYNQELKQNITDFLITPHGKQLQFIEPLILPNLFKQQRMVHIVILLL